MPSFPHSDSAIYVQSAPWRTAFDYDSSGNILYTGKAPDGASKSDPSWQIQKFVYDSSYNVVDILIANGVDTMNSVWNNRSSLNYS